MLRIADGPVVGGTVPGRVHVQRQGVQLVHLAPDPVAAAGHFRPIHPRLTAGHDPNSLSWTVTPPIWGGNRPRCFKCITPPRCRPARKRTNTEMSGEVPA